MGICCNRDAAEAGCSIGGRSALSGERESSALFTRLCFRLLLLLAIGLWNGKCEHVDGQAEGSVAVVGVESDRGVEVEVLWDKKNRIKQGSQRTVK